MRALNREGYIRLKSVLEMDRGQIIEKLGQAKKKRDLLAVVGKWTRLTRKLLRKQEEGYESEEPILSKKLEEQYLKLRSLRNHQRWILLIRKVMQKDIKVHKMQILSKWRMFARRLIEEDGDPNNF